MTDKIFYSADFSRIVNPSLKGWCLHLVCTSGSGGFIYNGSLYHIRKNDLVIVPRPDLISEATPGSGLKVEFIYAELNFINKQLPALNYGIRGGINLFGDPLLHANTIEVKHILQDFRSLREKIEYDSHLYYDEVLGAAVLSMVYDLFACHVRERGELGLSEKSSSIVKRLMALLESGTAKTHRQVQWYADKLNVSPKYLSDTVRRLTGDSVIYLIDRFSVPIVTQYLRDDVLSFSQIADTMEFTSLSYFSRYVTKHLGKSPSGYRDSLIRDRR